MKSLNTVFAVPFRKSKFPQKLSPLQDAFVKCDIYTGSKTFSRMGKSIRTVNTIHKRTEYEYLCHWIERECSIFTNNVFGLNKTLPIQSMWGTVNAKQNQWNTPHTHPESIISGVFWLSTPEGSGDFVMYNPTNIDWWTHRLFSYENVTTNAFNGTYFKIPPKEGTLLLFPSYVPHMVEPNTSDVNRISISFNLG